MGARLRIFLCPVSFSVTHTKSKEEVEQYPLLRDGNNTCKSSAVLGRQLTRCRVSCIMS